ncbi:type II secretion system protein GspM [Ferrimonas balearica]|uniref:type II secretion system protein GspM n=1 Tax=Ferrimonas balearica TaxID=44012 RepID=UPI001F1908E4|nr:type II secretion system protein M [Ferrimonas balearica]MBY6019465.1 type II secretion system protein M [Halomonas denitrificans]MBY6096184.1 type II secretion system protein M [Ferrimonas balearica]
MNKYWQQAQQWWSDRTDQEQRLLTLLAPVLVIGLFYWLVWSPISNGLDQAERAVQAERVALGQIKDNANRYISLQRGSGQRPGGGNLNQIASRTAAQAGLTIARMQPQGDKLQLWLEDTQFETLMGWLTELQQRQGVAVEALDITAANEPGLIQVRRLQLSQP